MPSQMRAAHHVGMPATPCLALAAGALPPAPPINPDPAALLSEVVALGLTRLSVPMALGGLGGSVGEWLAQVRVLAWRDPAAARIAWSQRMAIEALCHAPNVALRETWLPDLLDGCRAGVVPALFSQPDSLKPRNPRDLSREMAYACPDQPVALDGSLAVQAREVARGWRLSGELPGLVNLQWAGYVLVCPVWFASGPSASACAGGVASLPTTMASPASGTGGQAAWVLLRSEEDGISQALHSPHTPPGHAAGGDVRLREVYFREDELLADDAPALMAHLRRLDAAWREALPRDVLDCC